MLRSIFVVGALAVAGCVRAYHPPPPEIVLPPATEASLAAAERYASIVGLGRVIDITLDDQVRLSPDPASAREASRHLDRRRLRAAVVQTWARAYTVDELDALIAFYETGVGRGIAAKAALVERATAETIAQDIAAQAQR